MRTTRLRYWADVNPDTPEFSALTDEDAVGFMPLETVWADTRLDASRTRRKAEVQTGYMRFRRGDVLLPKVTPTFQAARTALVNDLPTAVGAGSTELHVLRARPDSDARMVAYATRTKHFVEEGVTAFQGVAGLQRVPERFVANFVVPDWPLEEQRRIADFLDDQVALLDRAINLRQHQTSLVDERLFTFISDLLAPPARDEGGCTDFPWLANCEDLLVKLGRVCDLQSGLTIDAKREGDMGYPYLRVANVQNGSLDLSEMKSVNVDPALALRCVLRPGDVLMTEGGDLDKLGRGAVWKGEIPNCLHQNHIFALRPHRERLLPEYLAAMTRTHHARRYFEITGNRTTNLASTNSTKILNFRFRLPSLAEQDVLLEQVRKADSAATRAVSLMREQVSLLRERKQAVITAAVTGEFDVTTAKSAA